MIKYNKYESKFNKERLSEGDEYKLGFMFLDMSDECLSLKSTDTVIVNEKMFLSDYEYWGDIIDEIDECNENVMTNNVTKDVYEMYDLDVVVGENTNGQITFDINMSNKNDEEIDEYDTISINFIIPYVKDRSRKVYPISIHQMNPIEIGNIESLAISIPVEL